MGNSVNRFMGPVQDNYQQTYVDQYVPMPFELMQRRAEQEQKRYDTVQSNWDALNAKMGERLLTIDNPLMKEKLTGIQGSINQALEEAGGDWRQLNRVVTNAATDYNTSIKSGILADALTQKEKYNAEVKAIDEAVKSGAMAGNVGKAQKDRLMRDYTNLEGVKGGATMGSAILYDASELQNKLQTWVSDLNPNKESTPIVTYSKDGKLLIDGWDDESELSKERIQRLSTAMFGDHQFQAMIDAEYFAYEPKEDKQTYAKKRFAQMFGGFDAYAYTEEENRRKAKETAAAENAAKTKSKFVPVTSKVSKNFNFKYSAMPDVLDGDGDIIDDPLQNLMTKNANAGTSLVNDNLKKVFFDTHTEYAKNKDKDAAFNNFFKKWADDLDIPYELEKNGSFKPEFYNSFLEYVATNDDISSTNSLFNGNTVKQKQFKQAAEKSYKQVQMRNQIYKEAHDELVALDMVNGNVNDVEGSKKALAAEELQLSKLIDVYVDRKFPDMSEEDLTTVKERIFENPGFIIGGGGINSKALKVLDVIKWANTDESKRVYEGTDQASIERVARMNEELSDPLLLELAKSFDKVTNSQNGLRIDVEKKQDDEYYTDKLNEIVKNRISQGFVSVPTANHLKIKYRDEADNTWKEGTLSSDLLYKEFIKPKVELIKGMSVKDINGKETTLQRYAAQKFGAANTTDQNTFLNNILQSGMFTTVADPTTGNTEIVFTDASAVGDTKGMTFRLPINLGGPGGNNKLGIGDGEIILPNDVRAKMRAWGDVYEGKLGSLENTIIGDPDLGVSIKTRKRGLLDDGKSFDDAMVDGSEFELNLNPKKLGLYLPNANNNGHQETFLIPNSGETNASDVLVNYEQILAGEVSKDLKTKYPGKSNSELAKIYLRAVILKNYTGKFLNSDIDPDTIPQPQMSDQEKERILKEREAEKKKQRYLRQKEREATIEVPNNRDEYLRKKELQKKYRALKKKDNAVTETPNQAKLDKLRQFRNKDMNAQAVVEPTVADSSSVQPGVNKLPAPASMDSIPTAAEINKIKNPQIQQQQGGDVDLSAVSDSSKVKEVKANLPEGVPVTPEVIASGPQLNNRNSYMRDSLEQVSKTIDSIYLKKGAKYKDTTYELKNRYGKSMNCSSFVEKVLTDSGYTIPKNDLSSQGIWANTPTKSKSMYKDWKKVPDSKLKDGTIIAFDTGGKSFDKDRKWGIDHIGIIVKGKDGKTYIMETSGSRNGPSLTPYKKRMAELFKDVKTKDLKKGYSVYLGKYEKS
jgi:hypothetical protein